MSIKRIINKGVARQLIKKGKNPKGKSIPQDETLKWVYVTSSNLWRIAYIRKNRVLHIIFKNAKNKQYAYQGVSPYIYASLKNSVSKGDYFVQSIKHRFSFEIV